MRRRSVGEMVVEIARVERVMGVVVSGNCLKSDVSRAIFIIDVRRG